jgi:hypothetical protein
MRPETAMIYFFPREVVVRADTTEEDRDVATVSIDQPS